MTTWWCDHNVLYNFSLSLNQFWNTIFLAGWEGYGEILRCGDMWKSCGFWRFCPNWKLCSAEQGFASKRGFLVPLKTGSLIFRMRCQNSVSWKWKRSIKSWQLWWPQSQNQNGAKHGGTKEKEENILSALNNFFIKTHYNIFNWSQRDNLAVWSGLIS